MHVDLFTLYLIIIGTLLASACLTYWEHRTHPGRSTSLRLLAAGFATLAAGCSIALYRAALPGVLGSALSNLVILSGYLLVLNAVAALNGRLYRAGSLGLLGVMALIWAGAGYSGQNLVWTYVSAFPIALVSGMTAWELLRCQALRSLLPLRIAVAVTSLHALLYLGRSFVLPLVGGRARRGRADAGQQYHHVRGRAVFHRAAHDAAQAGARGNPWPAAAGIADRLPDPAGQPPLVLRAGPAPDRRRPGREPLAVLAFDLDQFKSINDRYGHQTGDLVLKSFADIARGVLGPAVLLARIGGEEFAAVLAGNDARHAVALGEDVARRFAETLSSRVDSLGIPATVSIGLAQYEHDAPALAQGLSTADQALYRAKALGGNRLEVAQLAARMAAD